MPRRLSPNFWIAPVAGATFCALYAIDHLASRRLESRRIEQSQHVRDCNPAPNGKSARPGAGAQRERVDPAARSPACENRASDGPS